MVVSRPNADHSCAEKVVRKLPFPIDRRGVGLAVFGHQLD